MEITRTFENSFCWAMYAKIRWFVRKSLLRYAVAVSLITYASYRRIPTLTSHDIALRWIIWFAGICAAALTVHVISSIIESRQIHHRTVTFGEDDIVVNHRDTTVIHSWDWILSARESPSVLALMVDERPRRELYLPGGEGDEDSRVLREWLVSHGKLKPTERPIG